MRAALVIVIRLAALTVVYFICFAAVSASLLPPPPEQPAPAPAGATLAALLAVSFLNTAVLTYVILRSRWAGWRLILTIFFVFYRVPTVMSQIDTDFCV